MLRMIAAIMAMALLAGPAGATTVQEALAVPGRLAGDLERDQRDHPADIIPLLKVGPGDRVADIFAGGGYYSELLGRLVQPGGSVLLQNNQGFLGYAKKSLDQRFTDREVPGVVRLDSEADDLKLGQDDLDAALMVLAWHDTYYSEDGWPQIDRADFLAQVYRALKPGGRFVVVDHQAAPGAGTSVTHSLHRIEESAAQRDIETAGFVKVGESDVLRNPEDDHSLSVFDPAIRGHTDRFVLVFEKPAAQ